MIFFCFVSGFFFFFFFFVCFLNFVSVGAGTLGQIASVGKIVVGGELKLLSSYF